MLNYVTTYKNVNFAIFGEYININKCLCYVFTLFFETQFTHIDFILQQNLINV